MFKKLTLTLAAFCAAGIFAAEKTAIAYPGYSLEADKGGLVIKDGSGSRLLDTAVDYMRKNYSYPLTVEAVARRCGVDRSHLFRLFKQHLQLSPQQYLIRLRLNKAEELLQTTSLSVSEVAFSCGFNDLCHFSRLFKRRFGVPPSARRLPNS